MLAYSGEGHSPTTAAVITGGGCGGVGGSVGVSGGVAHRTHRNIPAMKCWHVPGGRAFTYSTAAAVISGGGD